MLTEFQIKHVWENMLSSETLSLYFADLASTYTRRKQWITGITFFMSSGAAASIVGKSPSWVPIGMAVISALASAYSIAVGLDRRIETMAKLHSTWSDIAGKYSRLWSHTYEDDAELQLEAIIQLERAPSELATTAAPNDQDRIRKWQEHVFKMYRLTDQNV